MFRFKLLQNKNDFDKTQKFRLQFVLYNQIFVNNGLKSQISVKTIK